MSHRHAPPVRHDAPGMTGPRSRNEGGELRQKRGDTHAGTIEELYHVDLGVRSDKQLKNILRDEHVASLNDLVHKKRADG
jgi:hypothetical protein